MISNSALQQPAGAATALPSIEADINYLAPMDGRPFVDVNDFSASRLKLEAHRVTVRNARLAKAPLSLDREGFVLVRQPLPKLDYRDPSQVVRTYLPVMQDLVKEFTGADKVFMTNGPITRFASPLEKDALRPAGVAHTDYTARSSRAQLRQSFDRHLSPEDGEADMLRTMHSAIDVASGQPREHHGALAVQTWRVLSNPPHDYPLAICAADSVSADEIVDSDFGLSSPPPDYKEQNGEFALYHFNPRHAWHYFPDMQPDEVLIFVGYDFNAAARSRALHTAFKDPTCPADAVGRASVETRGFAFFKQ